MKAKCPWIASVFEPYPKRDGDNSAATYAWKIIDARGKVVAYSGRFFDTKAQAGGSMRRALRRIRKGPLEIFS